MSQEEPQRLQFEQTDKDDSLDKVILDPYPEVYCLGDQDLRARIQNFNDNWPERYKKEYIHKVICIVEFIPNRFNVMHDNNVDDKLITGLMESKIKDYDDASWTII